MPESPNKTIGGENRSFGPQIETSVGSKTGVGESGTSWRRDFKTFLLRHRRKGQNNLQYLHPNSPF